MRTKSSINSIGFETGQTMGRINSSGSFKLKITKYIIGVDFYIVVSRSISLTDSFNTIIYLLLKQNGCHSVQSLCERCSLRNRQCPFRTPSTKAGTIPPRNTYYPQTDNKIERLNQTLKQYLRYFINYKQNNLI